MYFIITNDRAFCTPEITGTQKVQAKAGEMVLMDISRMKFYGLQGEWEDIENWIHPLKAKKRSKNNFFKSILIMAWTFLTKKYQKF